MDCSQRQDVSLVVSADLTQASIHDIDDFSLSVSRLLGPLDAVVQD